MEYFGDAVLEWGVTILIYLVGGYLVFVGKISIGSVFAFVSYSSYVTRPVNSLIDLRMHFASVKPSAERLYTFLNMEEERSGSKRVEKEISPILEFKNVRFQYTKDREVLKKVSLNLSREKKWLLLEKMEVENQQFWNYYYDFMNRKKEKFYVMVKI